ARKRQCADLRGVTGGRGLVPLRQRWAQGRRSRCECGRAEGRARGQAEPVPRCRAAQRRGRPDRGRARQDAEGRRRTRPQVTRQRRWGGSAETSCRGFQRLTGDAVSDILRRIETYKREEIAAAKRAHPRSEIEARAKAADPPRGFVRAILRKLAADDYAL